MLRKQILWKRFLIALLAGGWVFQPACVRRELEVLLAPEANSVLLGSSSLVKIFGPSIIQMFNS